MSVRGYENTAQNLQSLLDHFLPFVNGGNIDYYLSSIPYHQFNRLNEQEVKSYIQWIVDKTIRTRITAEQGLFLCLVSGYISALQHTQLPKSEEIKKAFDMLLNCLTECEKYSYSFNLLRRFVYPLQQISGVLVMNCSCPGWLTFSAYFYRFFEVKRLLDEKMPFMNYSERQYQYFLTLLLPKIEKVNVKNEFTLRRFLKLVFQYVPDGVLLFELCEDKHMRRFFRKAEERQKFFTDCYLDRLKSEDDTSVGEILKKLLVIPERFRSFKWVCIYDYLLKFLKSDMAPTDEDVKAFIMLSLSTFLPEEMMYKILKFLSNSASSSHQDIVLQFLSDPRFDKNWKSILFKDKIEIGKSWLKARLQITQNSDETKVRTAYRVLQEFTSCRRPVYKYQQELLNFVCKWLFDNVNHDSIIAELGKINNDIPQNFHDNFFNLAKDVLRKNPNLVNKDEILNQFLKSRYSILN